MTSHHELIVEDLKNKLALALEERDCAVEMWQLTKQVAEHVNSDGPSGTETRKELNAVKMEYSEAIKLLENKCCYLEVILAKSIDENKTLTGKIDELNCEIRDLEKECEQKEFLVKSVEKEKEALKRSLDVTKDKLKTAEQVSLQARDKVAEALSMAQDALSNEASLAEEKALVEEELHNLTVSYEEKILREVDKVRVSLDAKVEKLSSELHTVTLERNRYSHEVESHKAECRIVEKRMSSSNMNLNRELEDLKGKWQREYSSWAEERDMLKRQISAQQSEIEHLLVRAEKANAPCTDCQEFKAQMEQYRKLAKRWEAAADRVTTDFERYLQEAKELYWNGGSKPEIQDHIFGKGDPT